MKQFISFHAASDEEIHALWVEIKKVDDSVTQKDTNAKSLLPKEKLQNFFQTHCTRRRYMFSVKKCATSSCTLCKPPRLPPDVFQSLHQIPDPVPQGDRYQDFATLYGTNTSKQHRPSLTKDDSSKSHGMPFSPTAQYAKNVKTVVQCEECSKRRLIYSKSSLKKTQCTSGNFIYLW